MTYNINLKQIWSYKKKSATKSATQLRIRSLHSHWLDLFPLKKTTQTNFPIW